MKKFLIFIVMALLIWGVVTFNLNNSANVILSGKDIIKSDSSPVKMYYTVYLFGFIPVGKAVISDNGLLQYEGKTFYYLNAQAQGSDLISRFYNFSANIDSYLDENSFLPLIYNEHIQIIDKTILKEARYDQKNNIMEIAGEKRSILAETYEPLSVIFKLMRTDWGGKKDFDLNINTNQKNYAFAGTVEKQQVSGYNITLLKGKIFRRDKNPYHQSSVDILLAGDKIKTPVLIKVFASGAYITVRLTKSE